MKLIDELEAGDVVIKKDKSYKFLVIHAESDIVCILDHDVRTEQAMLSYRDEHDLIRSYLEKWTCPEKI